MPRQKREQATIPKSHYKLGAPKAYDLREAKKKGSRRRSCKWRNLSHRHAGRTEITLSCYIITPP